MKTLEHLQLLLHKEHATNFGVYHIDVWGRFNDDYQNLVRDNTILREYYYPKKIQFLNQVHGQQVVPLNQVLANKEKKQFSADAVFGNKIHQIAAVRIADCLPLIFYSLKQPLFGAIHAGWRGLRDHVIAKTISTAKAADCQFYIGPHIRYYQVGSEMFSFFNKTYYHHFKDKANLSLTQIAFEQLINQSVPEENIIIDARDTLTDPRLFSHRKGSKGRNVALVYLTE